MKRNLALLAAFILSLSSIPTLNCFADGSVWAHPLT